MPTPALTPAAFIPPEQIERKLRSAAFILAGTIRSHLPASKRRQVSLMHVSAALELALDTVRAGEPTSVG
jgi:hypothetical protein